MDWKIATEQVDATVALKAYNLYKEEKYKQATSVLLEILDVEPKNWQARFFLAACYYKNGMLLAAQRAFRFIYENTTDDVLKQKSCFAIQAISEDLNQKTSAIPEEFGGVIQRTDARASLDAILLD